MEQFKKITKELLNQYHCQEDVDQVARNPEMTEFKQRARLHQSIWRENKGFEIGTQPIRPDRAVESRSLGSRLALDFAQGTDSNFLDDTIRSAVTHRLSYKEKYQLIDADRLFCDLLSSMPMCFNLLGWFHSNPESATKAVNTWWPDAPGRVSELLFEWSPGRMDKEYLNNKSAFDAAFILDIDENEKGVIGIETKYHEHCKKEDEPKNDKRDHYELVMSKSKAFVDDAYNTVFGSDLQQILLDHLLILSMKQHHSGVWKWVKYVLVYPEKNKSFADASLRYMALLSDPSTFEARTIESLLDDSVYSDEQIEAFRNRYIWK